MSFRYKKVRGQRVPTRPLKTKRARKEFSKTADYMARVEKMRPYFKDVFSPDAGFNLHDVDEWTPAQKRKITRYFRVMAPRIESEHKVVKRYRRSDHLQEAIKSTLQEEILPGQTAAVFSIDPGQKLEIEFTRKHKAIVRRDGIREDEFRFDKNAFLKDWKAELRRVLSQTDAQLFKIIMGANRSTQTFRREDLEYEVALLMHSYPLKLHRSPNFEDRAFDEWLNGLIAFKGTTMRKLQSESRQHKTRMDEVRRERQREKAKTRRMYQRGDIHKMYKRGKKK